jgi:ornithine decarboxylase
MLWDRCIELGIESARSCASSQLLREDRASAQEKWFFDPFVPDVVTIKARSSRATCNAPWEELPTDVHQARAAVLELPSERPWHGYQGSPTATRWSIPTS